MAQHLETGESGEKAAREHIAALGYDILEKNWRSGKDEVDIIARHGEQLVFVEVKTRSTDYFGAPEDWVGPKKQRNLIRAANSYVEERDVDLDIRFDIIGIVDGPGGMQLNHIVDAFYPLV